MITFFNYRFHRFYELLWIKFCNFVADWYGSVKSAVLTAKFEERHPFNLYNL